MKIKICPISLLLALVTITLGSSKTEAQAINDNFPDTLNILIFVDDLTGREDLSFGLTVVADTDVMVPLTTIGGSERPGPRRIWQISNNSTKQEEVVCITERKLLSLMGSLSMEWLSTDKQQGRGITIQRLVFLLLDHDS